VFGETLNLALSISINQSWIYIAHKHKASNALDLSIQWLAHPADHSPHSSLSNALRHMFSHAVLMYMLLLPAMFTVMSVCMSVSRCKAVWHSSSALVSISEVNLCRAWLVVGWVTMSGLNSLCLTFILVCNQPPRSTQLSIPPGSVNEDQLGLGRKRQVWFIPLADECGMCR